jgi:Spy/CpxP family protein refolding chaperone
MMVKRALLLAVVAFFAALAGVFAGRQLVSHDHGNRGGHLHALLHEELDLSPEQEAQVERMERSHQVRRQAVELELRSDNARLADAIEAEHGYGPRVAEAIDRSHRAMGELQKITLEHLFEMRSVLRPDQAAKFDAAVTKALTVPESES